MKVVIIGGVAGGVTAAARLRRLDESARILILERSSFVSYANCGLPYYIGGEIQSAGELTLQTPASLWNLYRIEARVRHEAKSICRGKKTVTVLEKDTGREYEESYDKLILAPGAKPQRPPIPGVHNDRIYTLRTVEDTFLIVREAAAHKARSAVVVGGGFIGLEMTENLHRLGINVTLVEMHRQVLGQLDPDMAGFVHAHLRSNGVQLRLGCGVTAFEYQPDGVLVNLTSGKRLRTDMVLLAAGVSPDGSLARAAGLTLGLNGGIAVNSHMQTSDPDIYAVGDAAEVAHTVTGHRGTVPLAGPARRQARTAADHIAGLESCYRGAAGTSILRIFGLTAAATGVNEHQTRALNLSYDKVILSPLSHTSFYPGAKNMTLKLLFAREDGRILGAQIVGEDGVDKRIDVLATAMQAGMKAPALKELDLAYAPPYSSANDPGNVAGFMSENVLSGKVKQFFYGDLKRLPRDAQRLDVRSREEYEKGHAEGFHLLIPLEELRSRLQELNQEKPVYVMCQSGLRSYLACRILSQNGFDCQHFAGGYRLYTAVRNHWAAE